MRHRLLLLLAAAAAIPAVALADLGGHSHGGSRRRGRQETNEIQGGDSIENFWLEFRLEKWIEIPF